MTSDSSQALEKKKKETKKDTSHHIHDLSFIIETTLSFSINSFSMNSLDQSSIIRLLELQLAEERVSEVLECLILIFW